MKASTLIVLALFSSLIYSQPACYVSCSKEGCLPNNSTSCTTCDAGFTVLINQRCAISGPQSVTIMPFRNQFGSWVQTETDLWILLVFNQSMQPVSKSSVLQPVQVKLAPLHTSMQPEINSKYTLSEPHKFY